ncbi:hypothetical protein AB0C96_22715 [Streptomyces sp. NPDC048506]|uniref:WD40 repeat domain-containing protein n=1 Tax=Streptomyces sp. NPDC048506 TaxID=3155028 RepID=UPI003437F104
MSAVDELLNARPTAQVWHEVCLRLAEMDETELAAVTPRVLSWPAQQRPMPDDWWARWTAGDVRPYHSLAGIRPLGALADVQAGRALSKAGVSVDAYIDATFDGEDEDDDDYQASFPYGATAVAAPSGLSWLALGAAAEWHHSGGDIVGWSTLENGRLTSFLSGSHYHDEPHDMQISPDGRTVVTAVEGRWHAWSAATGEELWVLPERSGPDDHDEELDEDDEFEDEDEEDDEDDAVLSMDDLVRIGFSGDGRRVAAATCSSGTVAVIATETGQVLLNVPTGQEAFGPVALDADGELVAHASPEGRVVVRAVDGGAVLATAATGLTEVNALAFAPDGTALFAVGDTAAHAADPDARVGPAACLLHLVPSPDQLSLTVGGLVRPTELPGEPAPRSPIAKAATRAVWTDRRPLAFVVGHGSVLFDSDGRTLWADPGNQIVSFTPDGRAMVTVGETVEAWFLAGLALPERIGPVPTDGSSAGARTQVG